MGYRTERIDDVVIAVPDGNLTDRREVDKIDAEFHRQLEASQKKLLLDLSNTKDVSDVALGMLVKIFVSSTNRQAYFAVCNIKPKIIHFLTILKLVNVLHVYDTREDALAAMAKL